MFNKIKSLFKRKEPQIIIDKPVYDHLIAIARLSLIKPEALVRESKNVKSNAEYLFKMIKEQQKYEEENA